MAVTTGDGSNAVSSGTGTRTPGMPSDNGGINTDDLSVIFQAIGNSGTRTGTTSGGNGTWFQEVGDVNANGTIYVDGKVATSSGETGTYSVPGHATQTGVAFAVRFDGADTVDPFGGNNIASGSGSITTAAVSLTGVPAGSALLWGYRAQGAGSSTTTIVTPPSGFTELSGTTAAGPCHVCTLDNWSGGDTGSLTATTSGTALHRIVLIAILPSPQLVQPSGIASTVAFGTATIVSHVEPSGIASTVAFGSATVVAGPVTVEPSGIASTVAFGSPTATPGEVTVSPAGIASTVAFGSPSFFVVQTVAPDGIASTVAFGTPTVTPGEVAISPVGIGSTVAFGTPTILVELQIQPTGIASTVAVGTPTLLYDQTIVATGIGSTVAFGVAVVFIEMTAPKHPRAAIAPQETDTDIRDNDAKAVIA